MREGEATAGEQWASVAAGRQALPVNPFLGAAVGSTSEAWPVGGGGVGGEDGGREGMDKAGQSTGPFLSQVLFAEVIGKW